jgi:phosphoheptose isomerase
MSSTSTHHLEDLISVLEKFKSWLPKVEAAGNEIRLALKGGRKLLTAGNGGSAADALHLAEELVGRFDKDRPPLAAIALCADPTLLTCISNDYGFDRVYARQVEGLGQPGDVLVVFSTSGNSANIVGALQTAKARQLKTIAVLGKNGGACKGLAIHEIIVPSDTTARIQEVHTFILHTWLTQLESEY